MKHKDVAALAPQTTEGTLADLPRRNADAVPGESAFSRMGASGGWNDITFHQFADEVTALAKGFVAAGIGQGDRIGVMSRTRYEWTLVDFAACTAGADVVPIYDT